MTLWNLLDPSTLDWLRQAAGWTGKAIVVWLGIAVLGAICWYAFRTWQDRDRTRSCRPRLVRAGDRNLVDQIANEKGGSGRDPESIRLVPRR